MNYRRRSLEPKNRWRKVKALIRSKGLPTRHVLQTVRLSVFGDMTAADFGRVCGYREVEGIFRRVYE